MNKCSGHPTKSANLLDTRLVFDGLNTNPRVPSVPYSTIYIILLSERTFVRGTLLGY